MTILKIDEIINPNKQKVTPIKEKQDILFQILLIKIFLVEMVLSSCLLEVVVVVKHPHY